MTALRLDHFRTTLRRNDYTTYSTGCTKSATHSGTESGVPEATEAEFGVGSRVETAFSVPGLFGARECVAPFVYLALFVYHFRTTPRRNDYTTYSTEGMPTAVWCTGIAARPVYW